MTGADKVTGLTLFFMASVIPLIVKYAEVPLGKDHNEYIASSQNAMDVFSYFKSIYILIGCGILLLCLFEYVFSKRLKSFINWTGFLKSPFSIAFIIFLLAIIVSSLGSAYEYTVIHGILERYESVFILLGYFVIFSSVVLFTRSEFQCRFLIYGIMFSCTIIGLIGAFQFFKMDFFMTDLANKLVLSPESYKSGVRLTTKYGYKSYTTLFNPNSVGSYTALMLPLTVMGAVYYSRGFVIRIWFIICAIVILITAIGCDSAGGLAGLGASAIILLIMLIRLMYKKKGGLKILFGIIAGLVCITVIAALYSPAGARLYVMTQKLLNVSPTSSPFFYKDLAVNGNSADIVTDNGNIRFTIEDKNLIVSYNDSPLTPVSTEEKTGSDGQVLSVISNYSVPGFGDFIINGVTGAFAFTMNDVEFLFTYNEDNMMAPLSKLMKPIDLSIPVKSFGFEGMELWATSRGFIWSRTLPLLIQCMLIGSGPDSFMLKFPQDDIIGKVRFLGNPYMIVDKAHNLYLQTGVNTGVLSMLALIFIFGWYIITGFFSVLKGQAPNEEKWTFGMRMAIVSSVCGYAVASLATDSTVSVSPIFWMVLGLGVALQRRLTRE